MVSAGFRVRQHVFDMMECLPSRFGDFQPSCISFDSPLQATGDAHK